LDLLSDGYALAHKLHLHRQYSAVSHLHQLKFTAAHTLGFSCSTSRLPANGYRRTNYNSLTLQIFHVNLLFTEQSSSLTPITQCELNWPTCTLLVPYWPANNSISHTG
jgi:hypothetical protein